LKGVKLKSKFQDGQDRKDGWIIKIYAKSKGIDREDKNTK